MKWFALTCMTLILATGAAVVGTGVSPPLNGDRPADRKRPSPARRQLFAAGTVEGAQREAALNFEINGRIERIPVDEGRHVERGDVLAELDDRVWRQKLAEAKANLELARAERERLVNGARNETRQVARAKAELAAIRVEQARAELNRAVGLLKRDAISDQDYDDYRFAYQLAVAEHRHAQARVAEIEAEARLDEIRMADAKIRLMAAEVEQAQTMLEKTVLRAPTDGLVLRVDAEPGEILGPDSPKPVVTMANAERLRVRAYVEELDALSLVPGQRAYVIADGKPDKKYHGTVTWIAPSMGPKQHRHHKPGERIDVDVREVLILLDDPQDLVIGLPVEVFIDPAAPTERESPNTGRESDGESQRGPLPETARIETRPRSTLSRRSKTGADFALPLSSLKVPPRRVPPELPPSTHDPRRSPLTETADAL